MRAFHNDPAIKEKYIDRVRHHRELNNLIRGVGWENGKGCAVGCTLETYNHKAYEDELGIPEWLAKVEDTIFEGLPEAEAMLWPERFLAGIPLGADLEKIKAPFLIFVLESTLSKFDHVNFPDVKKSIEAVVDLYKNGPINPEAAARAAARAAEAAARAAEAAQYTKFADKLIELMAGLKGKRLQQVEYFKHKKK